MATSRLRPLSIGEILDAGIKVVTRHWKPLMTCIVGLVGPVSIVYVLILGSIEPSALELRQGRTTTTTATLDTALIIGFIGSSVLIWLTFLVAFTACFKAVSDAWLGNPPDVRRSLRFGLKRSPKVLLLSLVWSLGLLVAAIPCGIPMIWLGAAWSVSIPALLFERIGPFKALRRSFYLIKGRWWATLALVLVCYVLVWLLGGAFQVALLAIAELVAGQNVIANATAQVIGTTISSAIIYPYLAAVLTILYFDQRVRKEGFDLQLLAEGLGTVRDPDAPLPGPLIEPEQYSPAQRAGAPYWPPPPGWKPAPEEPEDPLPNASEWSHPAGWSAPSADPPPLPGSGSGSAEPSRGWDPPKRPDAPPSYPGSYPTRSTVPADQPASDPPSGKAAPAPPGPGGSAPASGWSRPPAPPAPGEPSSEDDKDKRDRKRADWLPPEAPRGPGGL